MDVDFNELILVGLAPLIWQIVEMVKASDITVKFPAPLISFCVSLVVAGIYTVLPEQLQSLMLAASAAMGGATILHEGKKITRAWGKEEEQE